MKLEDRVHLVHQVCLVSRDLMELEDRLEREDHLVHKECLAWRDRKVQLELMGRLDRKDLLDQMDLLEIEEHLVYPDPQDL